MVSEGRAGMNLDMDRQQLRVLGGREIKSA
jgi:hypothetical protein